MAARKDITAEYARQLLDYEPAIGLLRWKARTAKTFQANTHWSVGRWNSQFAGKVAGWSDHDGYSKLSINGHKYYSHRIAWLIVHGRWPTAEIDHRRGVLNGNRLSNLREATRSQNMQNACKSKNNTSGYIGVHWDSEREKWVAQIMYRRRWKFLGRFGSAEEAAAAYQAAKHQYHDFQLESRGG